MSFAIVGFGKIGQALAHAFARKNIDVTLRVAGPPHETNDGKQFECSVSLQKRLDTQKPA